MEGWDAKRWIGDTRRQARVRLSQFTIGKCQNANQSSAYADLIPVMDTRCPSTNGRSTNRGNFDFNCDPVAGLLSMANQQVH